MKNINKTYKNKIAAALFLTYALVFFVLPATTLAVASPFTPVGSSQTASAPSSSSNFGFFALINTAKSLINEVMPLVVSLAVLWLIWGIFQLIRSNDEKTREGATVMITYGVIFLFVMVTVWGLVNVIGQTLNLDKSTPKLPEIPSY